MNKTIGLLLAVMFAGNVVAGDAAKGKEKSATCVACHGADGNSAIAINPKLAGQSEAYIVKQLQDFKSGARENAMMAPMAANLSETDMQDIAAFYAQQEVQYAAVPAEYLELGRSLYRNGDADRAIPACMACHGADGNGMAAAGFPSVGGQHPEYVKAQLMAFRDGSRNNDTNAIMRNTVSKMSDKQIEALAYYMVGLH
ncbi:c-type cytochrome [Aliikangiella sp. IMCC44632]